jgi:hypothetical protein
VPIIRARPTIRMQPPIPNALGESMMTRVIPASAPGAMAALTVGSVACSNLSSMVVVGDLKGVALRGLRIRSALLIC